jgi:hypothetical protein
MNALKRNVSGTKIQGNLSRSKCILYGEIPLDEALFFIQNGKEVTRLKFESKNG